MKVKNQIKNKNYESIIGIIDWKKKNKLHIIVDSVLPTPTNSLGENNSILYPGAHLILTGKGFDESIYKEYDKVIVDGEFIKRKNKIQATFIANGEMFVQKLNEAEARRKVADAMLRAASPEVKRQCKDAINSEGNGSIIQSSNESTSLKTKQYRQFLSQYTPKQIKEELNERIIGQEELTRLAADFLYYHALRQLKPELPPRPMLISGPSGTGKTEVWRVIKKLFGEIFRIEIVDGASMTQEGWKGSNKLSSHIDKEISDGGILIVDEFDKLSKPQYEAGGSNVAASMQSEFLKLLEGEYVKKDIDKKIAGMVRFDTAPTPSQTKINTKKMGIVLVGAFEDIKVKRQSCIGFGNVVISQSIFVQDITDEEYIDFGVLPELVGRVAMKVTTNQLSDEEYIQIIHNQYSRVSTIINAFKEFGVDLSGLINDDEVRELIKRSKSNKTGVRWVSTQIENKILESIRENGVGHLIEIQDNIRSNNKEDEFFF